MDCSFAQMEAQRPSYTALDRRISSLFFTWGVFNVFLGAMLVFIRCPACTKSPPCPHARLAQSAVHGSCIASWQARQQSSPRPVQYDACVHAKDHVSLIRLSDSSQMPSAQQCCARTHLALTSALCVACRAAASSPRSAWCWRSLRASPRSWAPRSHPAAISSSTSSSSRHALPRWSTSLAAMQPSLLIRWIHCLGMLSNPTFQWVP